MMLNREIIMFYLKVGRAVGLSKRRRTRVKMANVEENLNRACVRQNVFVLLDFRHFPQNRVAFCVIRRRSFATVYSKETISQVPHLSYSKLNVQIGCYLYI